MRRRLDTLQKNLTTEEERKLNERNKFQQDKKKCIAILKQTYQDLCERNEIKRTNGSRKNAIMLNAKCRVNLKDADELVKSLVSESENTKNMAGKNPGERQKAIIGVKCKSSQHVKEMYDICSAMYDDDPWKREDPTGLMDGIEDNKRSFFRGSPRVVPIENVQSGSSSSNSSNEIMIAGPSQMQAQWMTLLEESDQMEAQYLQVIEENILTLNEMAIGFGMELDKQKLLLDDAGDQIDSNQKKVDNLTPQVDEARQMKKSNNRWMYLILSVIIVAIAAFVLIKFVFKAD